MRRRRTGAGAEGRAERHLIPNYPESGRLRSSNSSLSIFFSGSIETLFRIFPQPVLRVILFLAGAQLALGVCDMGDKKNDRFVVLTTTAFAIWNIGIAFVFGIGLHYLLKRNLVKL